MCLYDVQRARLYLPTYCSRAPSATSSCNHLQGCSLVGSLEGEIVCHSQWAELQQSARLNRIKQSFVAFQLANAEAFSTANVSQDVFFELIRLWRGTSSGNKRPQTLDQVLATDFRLFKVPAGHPTRSLKENFGHRNSPLLDAPSFKLRAALSKTVKWLTENKKRLLYHFLNASHCRASLCLSEAEALEFRRHSCLLTESCDARGRRRGKWLCFFIFTKRTKTVSITLQNVQYLKLKVVIIRRVGPPSLRKNGSRSLWQRRKTS